MNNFKSISEHGILTLAYNALLDRYFKEEKHNDDISSIKCTKYKEQLDELHNRILELENNN